MQVQGFRVMKHPPLTLRSLAIISLTLASLSLAARSGAEPDARASDILSSEMLSALGTSGPRSANATGSHTFDRVIGDWEFDCTIYPDDGKSYQFDGEWKFDWILDGTAIQDVWMGYKEGRTPGQRHMGTTLRFFDPKIGQWHVIFIVPRSGKVIRLQGGEQGERIVLNGVDVSGAVLRWSFNDIEPDSFLWRGETSHDGGKTWRTEQIMKLRRKRPMEE